MKTTHILWGIGIIGAGLLAYFKPWRKKYGGIYLYPEEVRELEYLVHGEGYPEAEALEIVLKKRLEYRGSSGWS
jgi:hypothetical protein